MPFDSLSFPSPASPAISMTGYGPTSQCFLTAYRFLLQPRQFFPSLAIAKIQNAFDFLFFSYNATLGLAGPLDCHSVYGHSVIFSGAHLARLSVCFVF